MNVRVLLVWFKCTHRAHSTQALSIPVRYVLYAHHRRYGGHENPFNGYLMTAGVETRSIHEVVEPRLQVCPYHTDQGCPCITNSVCAHDQ